MDDQTTQNITQLLDQEKYDEARQAIEGMISQPLTPEERGEVAFSKAMTYIRTKNAINRDFIGKAVQILKDIDELELAHENDSKERRLQELRERIKNL